MNFEFSHDQRVLGDHARKILLERCPLSEVHRILNGEETHSEALWRTMVESGWTATALPEAYGGFGMAYLELCVLAFELGRVCAPVPFSTAVYLAAETLLRAGSEEQKRDFLPKLADGTSIGTLALSEGPGDFFSTAINCRVEKGLLTGAKIAVPDGKFADYAIVAASENNAPSLFLARLDDPGVGRSPAQIIDGSRSYSQIEFRQVPVEPVGASGEALEIISGVFDRAAALMAFEQLGGAESALEMARKYATERIAFGRSIGSFQAIKHRLANLFVDVELARSNCYHGAYALAKDAKDLPIAAAAARISAGQAFTHCARENIQVHGGAGFTWEGDCQLFYRRARLLGLALGGERLWKDRLMNQLLKRRATGREVNA